jgi:hypothetical protein
MSLCFICLVEKRETPSKAECFFQGTSICREHITAVSRSDMFSVAYKLQELAQRFKEGTNSHAGNGKVAAKSSHDTNG